MSTSLLDLTIAACCQFLALVASHSARFPFPSLAPDRRACLAPSMQCAFPFHPLLRTGAPTWHLPCSVHSHSTPCYGQARPHGTFHAVCFPFNPLHRTGVPEWHLPHSAHALLLPVHSSLVAVFANCFSGVTSLRRPLDLPIAELPVLGFCLPLLLLSLSCCNCFQNQCVQPVLFCLPPLHD
jgi:hypothetical protein